MLLEKQVTLIVSTGCIRDVDNAQERPPANADFRTLPAGISTGGGTATTVAASNQIFLYVIHHQNTNKHAQKGLETDLCFEVRLHIIN